MGLKEKNSYEYIQAKQFFSKLDDDISELFEEDYKSKVAVNTLISLLIEKGIFTEKEFKESMNKIRKRVREE
ncbi:hypothetical protein GF336_04530 [Candidatus Woesearchaeota archaeon]|nr:hypothetical protein [Candidatus Woesearchaeota archaeon]